ncbi:MAG TPA: hypothetical protein VM307_14180 [Egibacteraceae bacterium]|nr:hypothetical protein [Egibacteraceae bacterium]
MRVHQCPRCELRYADEHEVKQHLVDDHHVDPETLERHLSGQRPDVHPHRDVPRPSHGEVDS